MWRKYIVVLMVLVGMTAKPTSSWAFGAAAAWLGGIKASTMTWDGASATLSFAAEIAPGAASSYVAAASGVADGYLAAEAGSLGWWATASLSGGAALASLAPVMIGAAYLCANNASCSNAASQWAAGHGLTFGGSGFSQSPGAGLIANSSQNTLTPAYASQTGDWSQDVTWSPGSESHYTVVGIYDTYAHALGAAGGSFNGTQGGTGGYPGGWPNGVWNFGYTFAACGAGCTTVNFYVWPMATSGVFTGTVASTPVSANTAQGYLVSDLNQATPASDAVNWAQADMTAMAPALTNAAQQNYGQDATHMTEADYLNAAKAILPAVSPADYASATNTQVSNSNPQPTSNTGSGTLNLPNPYPVTVTGLPDTSLQNDVKSALSANEGSYSAPPPSSFTFTDPQNPTVPDKKSLTTTFTDWFSSVQSLPIVSLLTNYQFDISGGSSSFSVDCGSLGTLDVDFAPYESSLDVVGNAFYLISCLMWLMWLFM